MKAIIMAGGEGSRLRPLTCDRPKPMMRLLDRPVMEYALKLLQKHGVREAAVTLGYLPDAIVDFFGDGATGGFPCATIPSARLWARPGACGRLRISSMKPFACSPATA